METKTCSRCRETKTLDLFYTKLGKPTTWCKACTKADRAARWRRNHPAPPPWVMPTEKTCLKCGETKPLDQFQKRALSKDGRQANCAVCSTASALAWNKAHPAYHRQKAREYRVRHPSRVADNNARWRYGIPWGTYDKMFAEQGGKCAICGTEDTGKRRRFHIDHDNETGIRGLLCGNCNIGIGYLKHSVEFLQSAIKYLSSRKRPST